MTESDRSFNAGRLDESVRYARRAALLYVPGAEHVDAAYQRMLAIARGAEVARDKATAALAWRAIRAASVETAHGLSPQREELFLARSALSRLNKADAVAGTVPRSTEKSWRAGLLSGSFLLSIGACIGTVLWALGADGHWRSRRALLGALVAGVGSLLWGVALLVV